MTFTTEFHSHTLDSPCLEPLPRGETYPTLKRTVTDGWYRCTRSDKYAVHDHGGKLAAHLPGDPMPGCPDSRGRR